MRKKFLAGIFRIIARYPYLVLAVIVVLTYFAWHYGQRVQLKSDFAILLPDNSEAVLKWSKSLKDFGSAEYMIVLIEGDGLPVLKNFADELAETVSDLKEIRSVTAKIDTRFFEKHAMLYLDENDLKQLLERVKRLKFVASADVPPFIKYAMMSKLGGFNWDELLKKYTDRLTEKNRLTLDDGYIVSSDKKMLIVLLMPTLASMDMEFDKILVARVGDKIKGLKRSKPGYRKVVSGITGAHKLVLEQHIAFNRDIKWCTIFSFIGIAVLFLIAYRSIRAPVVMCATLLCGIVWTLSITYFIFGYITIITGAFYSILMSQSVAYSIYFISRYFEEEGKSHSPEKALAITMVEGGKAIFTGAITNSIAFFAIAITKFKGFFELGILSGIGILLCFIALLVVLPTVLIIMTRIRRFIRPEERRDTRFAKWLSQGISTYPRTILIIAMIITVILFWRATKTSVLYDINALQAKNQESFLVQEKIAKNFGFSFDYVMAVVSSQEEMDAVCGKLDEKIAKGNTTIYRYESLSAFLPKNQEKKMDYIRQIQDEAKGIDISKIPWKSFGFDGDADYIREMLYPEWVTLDRLPPDVREQYVGISGNYVIKIYPKERLWEGKYIKAFLKEVDGIYHREKKLNTSGLPYLTSELMDIINKDMVRASILVFFVLLGVVFFDFRRLTLSGIAVFQLLVGIVWMFGIMDIIGVKLNYINMIIAPVIMGLSMVNGIMVIHRFTEDETMPVPVVIRKTGYPILITSITKIVSFGSFLYASYQGLVSLGQFAIVGIVTCMVSSLTILPTLLQLWGRRKIAK